MGIGDCAVSPLASRPCSHRYESPFFCGVLPGCGRWDFRPAVWVVLSARQRIAGSFTPIGVSSSTVANRNPVERHGLDILSGVLVDPVAVQCRWLRHLPAGLLGWSSRSSADSWPPRNG